MEAWELVDVPEVGWLDALESFPPVLEGWIQPCVSSAETSHD